MSSFYHAQSGKTIYVGGGIPGRSAYEEAVAAGYTGTAEEWLEALRGEHGTAGDQGPQGEQGPAGPAGQDGQTPLTLHPQDPPRVRRMGDVLICTSPVWAGGLAVTESRVWLRDGVEIPWATEEQYVRTVDDEGCAISCLVTGSAEGVQIGVHSNAIYIALPPVIIDDTSARPEIVVEPRIDPATAPAGSVFQVIQGVWAGVPAPEIIGHLLVGGVDRTHELDEDLRWTSGAGDIGPISWIEVASNRGGFGTHLVTAQVVAAPPSWIVSGGDGRIFIQSAPPSPPMPAAPTASVVDGDIIITE